MIDVNAFACGDGSIRVFSSLMDLMTDDELMAIIGHEIGHVVHADVKHAMKNAYLASAARNAAGAAEGSTLAKLSESQLGDVVTAFTDAQFSQKQEYAADEYGFKFCVDHGFSPYGMAESLEKLMLALAAERLRGAGYAPYYLYRQKYMSGSFENVGWAKPGTACAYNIVMMEELQSVLSLGAGGITKLVDPDKRKIVRLNNPKYAREYLDRWEDVAADKRAAADFQAGLSR